MEADNDCRLRQHQTLDREIHLQDVKPAISGCCGKGSPDVELQVTQILEVPL